MPRKIRPRELRKSKGPEAVIQEAIVNFLKIRDWHVMETHGNMYQCGFPDLYVTHHTKGIKWVEVKNPEKYEFTPAQLEHFPIISNHGVGIWIMTAATEFEYRKIFKAPNWTHYLQHMNPNARLGI